LVTGERSRSLAFARDDKSQDAAIRRMGHPRDRLDRALERLEKRRRVAYSKEEKTETRGYEGLRRRE
jgi:hypothetical protein